MDHQQCEGRRNYRRGGGGLQVTAKAPGEALITVKTEDGGKTASCTVTVKEKIIPVESISLNQTTLSLKIGEKETLQAMVSPENATTKNISWSSDKTDVATVDENGNVSANSVGTATITAKAGEQSATCTVTVKEKIIPVESITLDQSEKTLNIGETVTLKATVSPDNATNKSVTWSSDDEAVATVDTNGKVTAKSVGTATITATAGDKSATCTITVNPIRIEVSPGNATDKSVTWSFDKPSIATITNDGVVAIHNEGTVVFTVTTNDGGFTDSCTINIKKPTTVVPVSSVSLNKTTLTLDKGDSGTLTARRLGNAYCLRLTKRCYQPGCYMVYKQRCCCNRRFKWKDYSSWKG